MASHYSKYSTDWNKPEIQSLFSLSYTICSWFPMYKIPISTCKFFFTRVSEIMATERSVNARKGQMDHNSQTIKISYGRGFIASPTGSSRIYLYISTYAFSYCIHVDHTHTPVLGFHHIYIYVHCTVYTVLIRISLVQICYSCCS